MSDGAEHDQLVRLFRGLGAGEAAAATMARQTSKRATQLAAERGWTREEAMRHLLQVVVQGRAGVVPEGFTPPPADRDSGRF